MIMWIRNNIPNFITSLNLFCGCLSIILLSMHRPDLAGLLIFFAAVFDFLDGLAARILNAKSAIGADLDSLADVVSFGVAPGLIMYQLIRWGCIFHGFSGALTNFLPSFGLLIPILSAWRLARFNNDPSQSENFIGLPVPANAMFFAAFTLMVTFKNNSILSFPPIVEEYLFSPVFLTIACIVMSLMLVSPVPLFSLKFKSLGWNDNKVQYSFLIVSILLIALLQMIAVPIIVLLYILFSVLFWKKPEKNLL